MHLIATKSQPAAGVLALRWHSTVATNQCQYHADVNKTNGTETPVDRELDSPAKIQLPQQLRRLVQQPTKI
jgi:hypothetical protein